MQRQPRDAAPMRVDVPAHGVHGRPERLQRLEHLQLHQVAGVQDRVGALQPLHNVGQPPRSARQVRVGDHRDDHPALS